jgi:hypothetical protein
LVSLCFISGQNDRQEHILKSIIFTAVIAALIFGTLMNEISISKAQADQVEYNGNSVPQPEITYKTPAVPAYTPNPMNTSNPAALYRGNPIPVPGSQHPSVANAVIPDPTVPPVIQPEVHY